MTDPVLPNLATRRPALLIFLHWLTLILVTLLVAIIFVREGFEEKAVRTLLLNLHRSLGLSVALLTVGRLAVRLASRPLLPTAEMSLPARLLASATHLLLYAAMIGLPLIGWALSSANGKPVSFFGLGLPPLVEQDEDRGDDLAEYHEEGAWLFLGLIGIHAAAALFHHYVQRDNVLRAMLPARFAARR